MVVERRAELDPDTVREVLGLADAAAQADRVSPLDEQVLLHLKHGGEAPAVHLLARSRPPAGAAERSPRSSGRNPEAHAGTLVGYARVDPTDPVTGAAAELVVRPDARRRGVGRALLSAAIEVATEHDPAGRLRLWAHGNHPGASALARAFGLTRTRMLHQLRRSLDDQIPPPVLPEGVSLRSFRPGEDDQAWLAVNARAFADHPEQGRWTAQDLRARMAEPWFDPDGFLLAQRDGRLLGFHWTKVHDDGRHPHAPIGEVYVLGVDPSAHGLGLGTALTLAGLRYLRGRGLDQAMLYVDDANSAALALYTKLGFARWSVDVTFTRLV